MSEARPGDEVQDVDEQNSADQNNVGQGSLGQDSLGQHAGGEWAPLDAGPTPRTPPGGTDRWRPGSPVTPVGSRYGSRSTEAKIPPPPPPPPPRGGLGSAPFAITVIAVLAAAAAGVGIGHAVWPGPPSSSVQGRSSAPTGPAGGFGGFGGSGGAGNRPSGRTPFGAGGSGGGSTSAPAEGSGGPTDVRAIATKVDPALVDVNSTFKYQVAAGAGTGIVLTSNGEILTNNHVVDGATKITVTDVGNGKTYDATVVGYDSTHDIAVLQLQGAAGLQSAKLASSTSAAIGEPVVAIGNAGGTGGTPTSAGGSITAIDRSISAADDLDGTSERLTGLIQVNADVQSGDSGGSLVNASGQVVGMDTAASAGLSFQSSASQGFAIPIGQALSTAKQIESGRSTATVHVGATAFLGVLVETSSAGAAARTGTGTAVPNVTGVTVRSVVAGEGAEKAGLASGDTITSLGGHAVDSASALSKLLVSYHPGDSVVLGWTGPSGTTHSSTIVLGSGPPA